MVNAWSLLYDEYYGTMNETFPVKNTEPDDDIVVSTGSTASMGDFVNFDLTDQIDNITIDASNLDFNINVDNHVSFASTADFVYADTWPHADTLNIKMPDDYPSAFTALSDNDDAIAHLIDKPVSSGIEDNNPRKYKEDESIKALQDYISTTYGGHYTSDNNNVQTLDLIESVGDA